MTGALSEGDEFEATIDAAASGGHCVARHDGQVAFISDVIPGERVRAVVTSVGRKNKFVRARPLQILEASLDRVTPPCAHAGLCGGCSWQHVRRGRQLDLKRETLVDTMQRVGSVSTIAGVPINDAVRVEAVDETGLGWRTRMRYAIDNDGTVGLHAGRSHQVLPAADCLLPVPEIAEAVPDRVTNYGENRSLIAAMDEGRAQLGGETTHRAVTATVKGRPFEADINGFWQVHQLAPVTLVDAMLALATPKPEHRILDLYSGVGLFAAFLGVEGASVTAIESNETAVDYARRNTADLPNVTHVRQDVAPALRGYAHRVDTVVLDPPRTGAGHDVVDSLIRISPQAIVYVSCDAGTFARDVRLLADGGYELASLQGWDLFPMTKHLETVALLTR